MAATQPIIPPLAPPFSPGVLDDPVRQFPQPQNREPFVAVPDEKNAVVDESLAADQGTRDAADVRLHEDGVEADGERPAADEVGGDLVLVDGDGGEIGNPDGDFVGLEVALAAAAGVGVGGLFFEAAGVDQVLVGVGH